jgi:hypothetical protein
LLLVIAFKNKKENQRERERKKEIWERRKKVVRKEKSLSIYMPEDCSIYIVKYWFIIDNVQ